MKKIFSPFLLVAGLTIFSFSSCQKEYSTYGPVKPQDQSAQNTQRGYFKCMINGEPFEGEIQTSTHNTNDGQNSISIASIDYKDTRRPEDKKIITIFIKYYDGLKGYLIPAEADFIYMESTFENGQATYTETAAAEDNMIVLTKFGTEIAGNFNIKVKKNKDEVIEITGGSFEFPRN